METQEYQANAESNPLPIPDPAPGSVRISTATSAQLWWVGNDPKGGKPSYPRRGDVIHSKKSSKFNQDCTICHSFRQVRVRFDRIEMNGSTASHGGICTV